MTNMKNYPKGGRPTICTPEFIQKAQDYVNGGWEEEDHAFPSVVGLINVLDIARSTVYRWAESDGHVFKDILEKIHANQELVTLNRSIKGDYNAAIAKLVLGKHGYSDKVDGTLSGPDGKPIEVDQQWTVEVIDSTKGE